MIGGEGTLTDEQILGFGAVVEAKEDEAGVVAALYRDGGRIPLDGLLGADGPGYARAWGGDVGREDDELAACGDGGRVGSGSGDGGCGRRRSGEGEGRKERGEELHCQKILVGRGATSK